MSPGFQVNSELPPTATARCRQGVTFSSREKPPAGSQPFYFRKAGGVGPSFHILAYLGMANYPQTPHEEFLQTLGPSLLAKYVCRCQN